MLLQLNESKEEYGREMAQTPIFWNMILRSLQDDLSRRIATLVDTRDDVVSDVIRQCQVSPAVPQNEDENGVSTIRCSIGCRPENLSFVFLQLREP